MTLDPKQNSIVGDIMNDAYFRPEPIGGGAMAWQLDSMDEEHFAWINFDGCYLGHDQKPESTTWSCGIYNMAGNFINCRIDGLNAAIHWCEEALKLPNPLDMPLPDPSNDTPM